MAFLLPGAAGLGLGIGKVLGLAGSALGAVSSVGQGIAAKKAAKYNAAVNEAAAVNVTNEAAAKATEASVRTRQKLAAVSAAAAENGMEPSGSVSDVLDTVERQGALEGLTAIWDGNTRAIGYRNSAKLDVMQGKNAMAAGITGAFTSIFDGFSKVYA